MIIVYVSVCVPFSPAMISPFICLGVWYYFLLAFAQIVLNLAVRLAQPRITESLHPLVCRLSVSPWD